MYYQFIHNNACTYLQQWHTTNNTMIHCHNTWNQHKIHIYGTNHTFAKHVNHSLLIIIMLSVAMRQRWLASLDCCSPFMSLLWEWCTWVGLYVSQLQVSFDGPWSGDEGALSFCDQKTVESREPALVAYVVKSSWGVQPTADYAIDGSPIRSSMSLFVTLSIQVILMIERRCRITKACSFFTCRLYTVQASVLVFALKCATLNRSALCLDYM